MAPIGSGHGGRVSYLAKAWERLYGDRAIVSVQNPILLNPYPVPQPDIALPKPREDFCVQSFPEPEGRRWRIPPGTRREGGWPFTPKGAYRKAGWWTGKPAPWRSTGSLGEEVTPEGLGGPAFLWRPPRP